MNRLFGLIAARRHAKKQRPTAQRNFPIPSAVAGTSFDDRQKHLKKSRVGDKLFICHAPLPQHNEAAEIQNARTKKPLGYVRESLAAELLAEYGEGWTARGTITELTGGTPQKPNRGCNYQIEEILS